MALAELRHQTNMDTNINEILKVPQGLKQGHPVDTPAGTWHMDGDLAIFDANVHLPKPPEHIDHVNDINAYTSSLLEHELSPKNFVPEAKKAVRRPLSIRKIASSLTSVGL